MKINPSPKLAHTSSSIIFSQRRFELYKDRKRIKYALLSVAGKKSLSVPNFPVQITN